MSAQTFTTIRNKARSQVGTMESPYNTNLQKYGAWYGWNGVAWCDIFLSWVFSSCGWLDGHLGKSASVYLTAERFRKAGRYGTTPRVGALAIFNGYSHIELVTAVGSGVVTSIGGNTSAGPGSISNGGVVAEKKRSTSLIMGYCYPAYKAVQAASPIPNLPASSKPTAITPVNLVVDGDRGPKTIAALNRWTGRGNTTAWDAKAKKALQRKVGATPDAVIGPKTVKALQKVVGVPVAHRDGAWGRETTIYLQRYLNAR